MSDKRQSAGLTRREILLAGGLAVAGITLVPRHVLADATQVEEAMKALIGDKTPQEGRVTLEVPQIAENGNTVPLTVQVDSPMTADDRVKALHVLAERNTVPEVASYRFGALAGEARISTRIRVARTQILIVAAEMSDGTFHVGKARCKVARGGGGCG